MQLSTKKVLGVVLCALLSLPAYLLGLKFPVVGAPIFAIIIGMVLSGFLTRRAHYEAGIQFTSKKILQAAVVLLGFGLSLQQVLRVGATSLPVIISTILAALICAFLVSKALRIERKISVLVGVGSSICGGSAIAATAPVIKADDKDIATAISVIFFFNVIAAIIFPSLGQLIGLSNDGFALFAGTAINDTSSVTAAAAAWDARTGANTLDSATIVKLTRTLAIIPIAIGLSLYEMKREGSNSGEKGSIKLSKLLPTFIVLFLVAVIISTLVSLPEELVGICKTLSKYFICMAMLAIGLNTNLRSLIKSSGKALVLGAICWIVIILVSLLMQHVLGLL